MVLSWSSETLLATRAHRREALGERALMGRMRVGALVSLLARLFIVHVCARYTCIALHSRERPACPSPRAISTLPIRRNTY